jgi:hypothetical protein
MKSANALDFQPRRKFPRRQFLRQVGFLHAGKYYLGTGLELGEGGMSLSLPHDFPAEKKAVISFLIPGGSFISVRVEIRNINRNLSKPGYRVLGCAFQNLQFEHKREIRTYVSARPAHERNKEPNSMLT